MSWRCVEPAAAVWGQRLTSVPGPLTFPARHTAFHLRPAEPMGISMLLYAAPDPDLRAFALAHSALKAWLRLPRTLPDLAVHEHWRDLDAVIARAPASPSPSPLTDAAADWRFPEVADHGAYALSSTSTQRLLMAIEQVRPPDIEAYVRERWVRQGERPGQVPDLPSAEVGSRVGELELHLGKLKDYSALAVKRGFGLVLALWEDGPPTGLQ